ncbi:unnamed protein product [Dovyalis caffra]|uniref:Uncharacterized protein n=1 Tax=Dovyalis caffra TaxID=77055 RepID=A0AAV1RQA9_9ROSI|nr:unnamed protein product [Dovyalis caffra]
MAMPSYIKLANISICSTSPNFLFFWFPINSHDGLDQKIGSFRVRDFHAPNGTDEPIFGKRVKRAFNFHKVSSQRLWGNGNIRTSSSKSISQSPPILEKGGSPMCDPKKNSKCVSEPVNPYPERCSKQSRCQGEPLSEAMELMDYLPFASARELRELETVVKFPLKGSVTLDAFISPPTMGVGGSSKCDPKKYPICVPVPSNPYHRGCNPADHCRSDPPPKPMELMD